MNHSLKVFAGRSHPDLAQEICRHLAIPLGKSHVTRFSNENLMVQIDENVRGADVFVIQTSCPPVNEHLIELLIFIDALKHASAGRITAVMPYFPYIRSDKKDKPRISITARLMADLLQTAGADRVVTMDLHSAQSQGFFRIPVDHMTATPILADHFMERQFAGDFPEGLVVVSPDAGRAKLANHFAEKLGARLAVLAKQRPEHNTAEITFLIGDVEGKAALLIDDMIDTAGTLCAGAAVVKKAGATKVLAAATHGIFSGKAFDRLEESVIEEIVVTDTIPVPEGSAGGKIQILSVDRILSDTIHNVFCDESVSEIFAGENQLF